MKVTSHGRVMVAHYSPGTAWGPRRMTDFELVWMLTGSARWTVWSGQRDAEAAEHHLSPGWVWLAQPGTDERYEWDPRLHSSHAFVHFQLNNVRLAVGDLRRALALDPNHFKALDGLAQVLRDIGEKRAALEVLRRLFEVHPYWPGTEQAIEELSREVEGQGI